ncbi:MAG: hypothetical protein BWY72_01814 [Bacteroidetes bacterium ADurb.Bin416]|nr:MAG: hypothetical protein BWY72_01814 [Bacteroidetes bacterium ADurb.Bin416]
MPQTPTRNVRGIKMVATMVNWFIVRLSLRSLFARYKSTREAMTSRLDSSMDITCLR